MTKTDMIVEIERIIDHEDVKREAPNLEIPKYGMANMPMDWIREAYEWAKGVDFILKDLAKIYALLTPELWKRYDLWGDFDDHQEVKLRNKARHRIKKLCWNKNLPLILKEKALDAAVEAHNETTRRKIREVS